MTRARRRLAAAALALAMAAPMARGSDIEAAVAGADGEPLADVALVAEPLDAAPPPAPPSTGTIEQRDKQFEPYVTVVRTGTAVSFPNLDAVRHHVYSFSPAKTFELPLYAGTPAAPVIFDRPGVVALGCNIHDWMIAYVYVVDTPWFAVTGADGRAAVTGLPAGRYRVHVWHPRMSVPAAETARKVTLAGTGGVSERWMLQVEPEIRARRAPLPGAGSY